MKVLHVIPSIGPLRGGPSFVLRVIAEGLAGRGVEVHVVTTDDNAAGRSQVPLAQPVVERGVTYWFFPRQMRFYILSRPLTAWLKRHVAEYDVVHIHTVFSYCSNMSARIARRQGVPYIIRPLGVLNRWGMKHRRPWLKQLSFRFLESRILAGAALVHYTSEQERLEASELGVTGKSIVIPNPVDVPAGMRERVAGKFRARHPELAGRTLILFLSRLDPKKGLDLLLPAFAQIRTRCPDATLVLAGAGDPAFGERLRQQAAQLGLGERIFWAGFLTGEDKWAALAGCDLFVLPSYSENFGVAALEAMTFRLPLVVSDQVAIQREISEAQAGLVVPCEVEALAGALARLVEAPELRARLAKNAEGLAQDLFSREAVNNSLIGMYRGLIPPATTIVSQQPLILS